jgi:GNAT superfamily N-acetyltransferase
MHGGVVSIRKAKEVEASKIKDLVTSLSHFYLEDKNASLPQWFLATLELSEFQQRILSTNFVNYVYTENDIIIGYIAIKDSSHVYHLFVAEGHQGKGIAKELLKFTTSKLSSHTFTVRSSIYAVPIYKAFGFIESESAASKGGIRFQPMEFVR